MAQKKDTVKTKFIGSAEQTGKGKVSGTGKKSQSYLNNTMKNGGKKK